MVAIASVRIQRSRPIRTSGPHVLRSCAPLPRTLCIIPSARTLCPAPPQWDALSIAHCLMMEVAIISALFLSIFYWVRMPSA